MSAERVEGSVIEIIYANPENGYTVCEIDSKEAGLFTATGYMPYISEGEHVVLHGAWFTHHEYGEQFKAEYYETLMPEDENAILQYLSSGIVPGIREATAKKLLERFGKDVLKIMLAEPLRLAEIKGISESRARKIGEEFASLQSVQNIVMFLQQYRISANMAVKVHRELGNSAVEIIKKNPYILADRVEGVSFKTADNIAYMMGIPKNNPERIRSGLKYFLAQGAYASGHTYLPFSTLVEHGAYNLGISEDEAENQLNGLALDESVVLDTIGGKKVCYLAGLARCESYTARRIISLAGSGTKTLADEDELDRMIAEIANEEGITLAPEQFMAAKAATSSGCVVITGGPGTGKTTTINTIIKLLKEFELKIVLAAPTGRAAKRMSQVCGMEAMTIHRLLGVQRSDGENMHIFCHDEGNPLEADVVIVDEMSMIDITLMHSFLKALKPGARLILSGDADQLPSVGPGRVLKDIIEADIVPTVKLARIFRQAQESLIVLNAHRINFGEFPDLERRDSDFFYMHRSHPDLIAETIADLYKNRLPVSYGFNPVSDIQILSPSKKGIAGVHSLNEILQRDMNPPDFTKQEIAYGRVTFRVGDKVMQTKNNYDMAWLKDDGEEGMGIYNGDMGIIANISLTDKFLNIVFDEDKLVKYDFSNLDELELAYAITVHKSQGSEFPVVIMPLSQFPPMLMCRNLLYTAVTRAKQMVILVGSSEACARMVSNANERERFTGLEEKLRAARKNIQEEL